MYIGYLQFAPRFGQIQKNLDLITEKISISENADLIVLPELPFTGYNFSDRDEVKKLAEEVKSSRVISELKNVCAEKNLFIVTGFAEKAGHKYFNSAVLIGPDGPTHKYRKIHLFNKEKQWFDAGDIEFSVQDIKGVKIGMMVCWDWIFPEAARTLALQGADIICHPSNLVLDYCQRTMVGRSIENSVFSITANRYGKDDREHGSINFTGRSQIVDPRGEILHSSAHDGDDLAIIEINTEKARDKKITGLNHIFEDRRPEFYA